jgi:DNA-binding response OmpR family regulator
MTPTVNPLPLRSRVLIVDADVAAASALSRAAQAFGCKTAVAFGGGMALRVAELFTPDLILLDLDLELPGQDVDDLLAQMRADGGPASRALCVGMTATPQGMGTDVGGFMGVDHLVHKPVPGRVLHDLIAEVRERSSLHQRRPKGVVPERDHA